MRVSYPLRNAWPVARVGYRVPRTRFDGAVHSVFDRACNLACDGALLTIATRRIDGPTMMALDGAIDMDFARTFRRGDAVCCRDGLITSPRATLDLRGATVWHAPSRRAPLPARRVNARVDLARDRLDRHRCAQEPNVDGGMKPWIDELQRACRALDAALANECIGRLVGWGEGLTPAGDDVLVGLRAALAALSQEDERRSCFLATFDARILRELARTTAISAHYLRLATRSDFNADLVAAVDALQAESDLNRVTTALDAVLAFGATSGAATLAGVVCGFSAWHDDAALEDCA